MLVSANGAVGNQRAFQMGSQISDFMLATFNQRTITDFHPESIQVSDQESNHLHSISAETIHTDIKSNSECTSSNFYSNKEKSCNNGILNFHANKLASKSYSKKGKNTERKDQRKKSTKMKSFSLYRVEEVFVLCFAVIACTTLANIKPGFCSSKSFLASGYVSLLLTFSFVVYFSFSILYNHFTLACDSYYSLHIMLDFYTIDLNDRYFQLHIVRTLILWR